MSYKKLSLYVILIFIIIFPLIIESDYILRVSILILIWGTVSTAWSYMGRFGLISLGHGAFLGIGSYITVLMFNNYNITPIIGIIVAAIFASILAFIIGYGCFKYGVLGDYFALVTLALGALVALILVALRDMTGGSLGITLESSGNSMMNLTFEGNIPYYYLSLICLILAIYIWKLIDKSYLRLALVTIEEDEQAASSLGINVLYSKMIVTIISAIITSLGGALYAIFISYINPHTVSGVGISLAITFKAILGGMFELFGPIIGAAIIVSLEEILRISFGAQLSAVSQIAYGLALLLLIIFMPKGIWGTIKAKFISKNN